ncbi:SWIM zinc finger family protein, partial [Cupriavidus necator]
MSVPYQSRQIAQWLDPFTVSKARGYASAVSELRWIGEDTLAGLVQGTRTRPYDVRVFFHDIDDDMWVQGECTCPVGVDCKHVAALLIAGLANRPKPSSTGVRAELVSWLEGFRTRRTAADPVTKKKPSKPTHALAYVIGQSYRGCEVTIYKARVSADGTIRSLDDRWQNVEKALIEPPKFIAEEDLPILRGLWLGRSQASYTGGFGLQGVTGAVILEQLMATGRAFVSFSPAGSHYPGTHCALHYGPVRSAQLTWQTQPDTRVRPVLQAEPPATLLLTTTQPCWYADADSGEAGILAMPWPSEQLADFLSMPAITLDEAALVGNVLREVAPDLPMPPAHEAASVRSINCAPVPVLALDTLPTWASSQDFATVSFDYAGHSLPAHSSTTLLQAAGGEVIQVKRDADLERKRLTELQKAGFRIIRAGHVFGPEPFPADMLGPEDVGEWQNLVKEVLPVLRANGWRVVMTDAFRHNVIEIEAIDGSLRRTGDGWFDVEMGITVNGRTVRLEPLLSDLFRRDSRWLSGKLDGIPDDEAIDLKTDRNERLRLCADRLKPVVRVLIDLFDSLGTGMRISEWDAARLHALDQTGRWQFDGAASI